MKSIIALVILILGVIFFYMSQNKHTIQKIDKIQKVKVLEPLPPKDIKVEKKVQTKKSKTIYTNREEINTTIQTKITLKSKFTKNSKEYKYIWKEGKNIIGVGDSIERSFSLGERNLSCKIFDDNSLVGLDTINVIAWRYRKEMYYYFSTDTDKYELLETKFFNHLNQLILSYSSYDRSQFTYNEYGKVLENRYEYINYPNSNYTITNIYDGKNLISMEKVDDDGNSIESHIYDEEGKEIIQEELEQEELEQEENSQEETIKSDIIQKKPIKIYNKDGNLTHWESINGLYQRNFKYEKGRVVYVELIYPNGKKSKTVRYDDKGRETYIEYKGRDKDNNLNSRDILNKEYNNKGNLIRKERKYSVKENIIQHTVERWSYKNGKKLSYKTEALVGVCPCSANLIKEETIYHYDKDGNLSSTDYKYQREGDDKLKIHKDDKKIITYTNELDD